MLKKDNGIKNLQKFFRSGLWNQKAGFVSMSIKEWDIFAKLVLEINKDLKKSKNIRNIILSSAIVIERFIDLFFISIYSLKSYPNFDNLHFLAGISFNIKIKFIGELKKISENEEPHNKKIYKSGKRVPGLKQEGLSSDAIKFLRKLKIEKLEKIRESRNIIAHNWEYKEDISKKFGVKGKGERVKIAAVKNFCLVLINELVGVNLKTK